MYFILQTEPAEKVEVEVEVELVVGEGRILGRGREGVNSKKNKKK